MHSTDGITLLPLLARNWAWILLRGILAILFGIFAIVWPLLTLQLLMVLYGAWMLVDGFVSLFTAFEGGTLAPRWWLALTGVAGIWVGIMVLLWPATSALVLLLFVGGVAIARGVMEIAGALRLRKEITGEWLLILSGVMSLIFGITVILFPEGGAAAIIWLMAAWALIFGLLLCGLALRLRSHAHSRTA